MLTILAVQPFQGQSCDLLFTAPKAAQWMQALLVIVLSDVYIDFIQSKYYLFT
jgi:hypothetical protein